jgi:hypothetical protein
LKERASTAVGQATEANPVTDLLQRQRSKNEKHNK